MTGIFVSLHVLFYLLLEPNYTTAAGSGYKGRYGLEPAHYEVVVPQRITENGEFISHMIPHHYKRSYYNKRQKKDISTDDLVHYLIPIAGEGHHVELAPNNDIMSPSMVIETYSEEQGKGLPNIKRIRDAQCHFRGTVRGHPSSRAAISTCDGLSGYIRTKRGYYIIEPAASYQPLSGKEHPHLVYQHETYYPEQESKCYTSGDAVKILTKRSLKRQEELKQENATITTTNTTSNATANKTNAAERHIEIMVTLDHAILQYHKSVDIENYVLTVFNMAHDLFHDASLGTDIDLAIVRLIRLEKEDHEMNLGMNKDINKTLDNFRLWQAEVNPGGDKHPNHHDVAILLTRMSICADDRTCGFLGAARIGSMCDPDNSAAICQDSGLRLGFVIAHELGHTLTIPHDSEEESGCCDVLPDNTTTIMSPSISTHTSTWSNCSGKYLNLFISSGLGSCMYDLPTEHSFELVDMLPGVMYGGDFQCRALLGPNAALCDTGIDCENLICYLEDKGCVETYTPLAPGTSCGEKKWCYEGRCIEIGERPGAIDGGWSKWTDWSDCSRTCGSGVAFQERYCNSPPPSNGGRYCAGDHRRHKICSTDPCDFGQPSFRDVQCAEFDDWVYPEDGKLHMWKSYRMPDENPCILFCVNDEGSVASLKPRVVDGTTCLQGMRDICINGLCREIPCDLDLESHAVEDGCGVCHGDGTSCKIIDGEQFFQACSGQNGKNKFLVLPTNSVNIKIEELEPTESRIQVRSEDGKTVYIKGNALGMFNVPGSKAWLGMIRSKQEALDIPGPISATLVIWIMAEENVTMKYSYGVQSKDTRKPEFSWDFIEWTRCSAQCGPGTQESVARCVEKQSGLVDDSYCKDISKPKEQIRPCEVVPCTPRWFIGDWQKCNKCPSGRHIRIVKCVLPTGEGEGESDVVDDSECVGPKPKQKESCTCPVAPPTATAPPLKLNLTKRLCNLTDLNPPQKNETKAKNLTAIDFDHENIALTIHVEMENGKYPPGIPHKAGQNTSDVVLQGKEALLFLDAMQKDFSNKKTKV